MAVLCDWLACIITITEYRKCGHIHIHVMLTGLAASTTFGTVYFWFAWWHRRRAARAPMNPPSSLPGVPSRDSNAPKSRGEA